MKNIDKIVKHYHRAMGSELLKVNVPEWEMDIYFKKSYPFEDEAKIVDLQTQGKLVEALVMSLVVKARDKDGKRLFNDADMMVFMKEADTAVVTRVASEINNQITKPTISELTKE